MIKSCSIFPLIPDVQRVPLLPTVENTCLFFNDDMSFKKGATEILNSEGKKVSQKLMNLGYEAYVSSQGTMYFLDDLSDHALWTMDIELSGLYYCMEVARYTTIEAHRKIREKLTLQ